MPVQFVLLRQFALLAALVAPLLVTAQEASPFRVYPPDAKLQGNFAQVQIVASQQTPTDQLDRARDLTPQAKFTSNNEAVATVTPAGRIIPRGDGAAVIQIMADGGTVELPVTVTGVVAEPVLSFRDDVRPVINKNGCVMGGCHSAQYGQGGFKLTVFGFDSVADREAIVRDSQGRRVNFIDPTDSLLLKKPTMSVPHGGGRRLELGSRDYELIAAWIRGGAPAPSKEDREIAKLVVTPAQRLAEPKQPQQLRVEAHYADGEIRDVTAWARYDAVDESVVTVNRDGLCTVQGRGQTPVMVRFEGQAGICTFVVPYGSPATLAGWSNNNFIDELAAKKFLELGIEPSGVCDDLTFLRRIFLDAIGTLPSIEEIQEFAASTDPDKRQQWIDRVLGLADHPQKSVYNGRYAAYWTLKWSDLVRNNSRDLQDQGMWSLHNWIKEQFRANVPFNKFVGELVQGKGSVYSNGPANYFLVNNNPNEAAESTAQLFLGVRLQCAQCHHHPFEKYGQDDYYSFAAFFARVGIKTSQEFGLFRGERVIMARTSGEVRQPRSGKTMSPKPLDAPAVDNALDRRIALAEWMTGTHNHGFAKATVNRYLNWLLGRGLVDPVDDLRATNPPTNVALMEALTDDLLQHQYDLKHLIRTVMSSRLYQLESQPTSQNVTDERFFSHFHVKRLTAEPLLDAIDYAAGTKTKFKDLPLGTRAIEIPDAEYPDFFLNTFAKPRRTSVCECERPADPNLAQALHTLNGDILSGKIADKNGRVAKLVAEKKPHAEIVTDLYLATLCRPPTNDEITASERLVAESPSPQEGYEDLLWALINSKAFLFVR